MNIEDQNFVGCGLDEKDDHIFACHEIIRKLRECYEKWKNPNVSYVAFLNRIENQRGNEAWETIEIIMKDMER